MKRVLPLVLATLAALVGCSGPQAPLGPTLNGTYSGVVHSSGYAIGAMAVELTTSSSQLSGVGCFVALDYSTACNVLSGSLSGSNATFRIGALNFTGRTDGSYIDTTFRSDDGTVVGRVHFTQGDAAAQTVSPSSHDASAGRASEGFLEHMTSSGK